MTKNYLLAFFPFICFGQNLVSNPDFENVKFCPKGIGQLKDNVVDWSLPNSGTSDVFSECGKGEALVPKNVFGFQEAKSGANYAGIYAYVSVGAREYIQGKLEHSLEADKIYKISFWVSLSEISDYAVDGFGFLFSENEIKLKSGGVLSPSEVKKANPGFVQIVAVGNGAFLSDKSNWTLVEATFKASGRERFFSIGNFRTNTETTKKLIQKQTDLTSYYYIDLVEITAFTEDTAFEIPSKEKLEIDKSYTLPVSFEFDSAKITPEAESKLEEIIAYLESHPDIKLRLSGHTDNVGSEDYNRKISLKRVQSVAHYLVSKNVESQRIQTFGFGESQPIDDNATDVGRAKNRRVEFVLFQ
ncbi:OmpA family protein [Flavobacterium sp.]|uniref:OmpA family protein n=1 Tax=Flavobacterium sp. TaxID=239 RepID=UPI0012125DAD|nr:OmpA family protein [Flavobacterium sp.]RZJ70816.1 MAG: OmpA family protein [Flavobacterium sp.]